VSDALRPEKNTTWFAAVVGTALYFAFVLPAPMVASSLGLGLVSHPGEYDEHRVQTTNLLGSCCFGMLLGLAGLVVVSSVRRWSTPGARASYIRALVEGLFLGVLSASLPVYTVLFPGPDYGRESSAIGAMKTIATAEALFREGDKDGDGKSDYGDLAELLKAGVVDEALGSGTKNGYTFVVTVGKNPEQQWSATATPREPVNRHFFVDQTGIVRWALNGPADASSATLGK
jgi:hypothetical protein